MDMNTTLEIIQNIDTNSTVSLIKWIQDEVQGFSIKCVNQFSNLWLCKQNPFLLGTAVVGAASLAIFLEYFRNSPKIEEKYEILLAAVVRPNSTPEDVAVNCTFGALSVGMKTNVNNPEILEKWKNSGSEKKVVAVDNEDVLQEMQRIADLKKIVNVLIKDIPTSSHSITTLAIGPALPQDLTALMEFGRVIGQSKITL
ncbi:hypothetical protein WDU94_014619 [Cyamophila willieti]